MTANRRTNLLLFVILLCLVLGTLLFMAVLWPTQRDDAAAPPSLPLATRAANLPINTNNLAEVPVQPGLYATLLPTYSLTWSHDQRWVATTHALGYVRLLNTVTGEFERTYKVSDYPILSASWHPNNTLLSVAAADGFIRTINIETGEVLQPFRVLQSVWRLDWNPQGTLLASTTQGQSGLVENDTAAYAWDPLTGELVQRYSGATEGTFAVGWNVDGSLLASGNRGGQVMIWTVNGTRRHTLTGHAGAVATLAWHPSAAELISGGPRRLIRWDVNIGEALQTVARDVPTVTLDWLPDGSGLLVATRGTVELLDAATLQVTHTLPDIAGRVVTAHVSPDGQFVGYALADGRVRVVPVAAFVPVE